MLNGNQLPSSPYSLEEIPDLPKAIWHIDNFGNCKTTLTTHDLAPGTNLTRFGDFPFHEQLRNVPDKMPALIQGSSGIANTRFLELVMQQANFATVHSAKIGDDIYTQTSHFRKATT